MKKQTQNLEERLLEYSVKIKKNVEQPPNWMFVFHSMLDVRCSSFKTPII